MKGFFAGITILLIVDSVWLLALSGVQVPAILILSAWAAPFFAALVCAVLAPRHKLKLAVLLAVPGAIFLAALNLAAESMGLPVDFYGFTGASLVLAISLVLNLVLCTIGGTIGSALRRRRAV